MKRVKKKLSSIGLLIVAFSLLGCEKAEKATLEPSCKIFDPDISTSYSGGCEGGLAHGKGVAKGRDTYEGDFERGEPHGNGVYSWGDHSDWPTERWDGWFHKGLRVGFGVLSVEAGAKTSDRYRDVAVLEGNRQVTRGLWIQGTLFQKCDTEQDCLKYIPSINLSKYREIASKSDALATKSNILMAFMDFSKESLAPFEKVRSGAGQCIQHSIAERFLERYPKKTILTGLEMIELFAPFEDRRLLFAIFGRCILDLEAGVEPAVLDIPEYQQIDIEELRVDIGRLAGQKIQVRGVGLKVMGDFAVRRDPGDSDLIMIDWSKLPRDQKLSIARECTKNIVLGCSISVRGVVRQVGLEPGIAAEKIEVSFSK